MLYIYSINIQVQNRAMTYQLTDEEHLFPTNPHSNCSIHDEQMSAEMKLYLSDSPDKMRRTGNWLWQAPNAIKRLATEPGFLMACKYMGLGHFNYLVWNHRSKNWYTTILGGANGHDATSAYSDWQKDKKRGSISTIEEWMNKFNCQ